MRLHLRRAVVAIAALLFAAPSLAKDEPTEATVACKDGSTAKAGRGACRGHGGVDKTASAKTAGETAAPAAAAKGKETKKAAEESAAGEVTVVCKDGSTSKGGRGACRGHGGVDRAATGKAAAAPPVPPPATPQVPPAATVPRAPAPPIQAPPPAAATERAQKASNEKRPPIARCKDGTFSHAEHHTGACSNHGGVAEWLDKDKK